MSVIGGQRSWVKVMDFERIYLPLQKLQED